MYITVINRPINLTLLHSNNLACSTTHLNSQNYTQLVCPTARIINGSLLAYVYISILCLVYVLPFKIHYQPKSIASTRPMSHQKTTVTQQKEHKFDILAVSRLIKGTIYREKTEVINPWEVRRPPAPPPK